MPTLILENVKYKKIDLIWPQMASPELALFSDYYS